MDFWNRIKNFFKLESSLRSNEEKNSFISQNNQTPTDIIIETGSPLPEEPVILSVTLPNGISGGYFINGEQKPVIQFIKGATYIFDQ